MVCEYQFSDLFLPIQVGGVDLSPIRVRHPLVQWYYIDDEPKIDYCPRQIDGSFSSCPPTRTGYCVYNARYTRPDAPVTDEVAVSQLLQRIKEYQQQDFDEATPWLNWTGWVPKLQGTPRQPLYESI
ncbi:hypothetical protein N7481_008633 [Penicillium waksmanii]|uniref:uncharacterized protein n=1 Tax=Penicillium waksmanii TaxID=69791 RepID=UPI0025490E4F|nr:uncharacterized protein N7481_008633 [Penicillium waksmanii]KAJ5974926.1 hypothetical protein N7481_008633 [Penicillium waksmanii]